MLERVREYVVEYIVVVIFLGGLFYTATASYKSSFEIQNLIKSQNSLEEKLIQVDGNLKDVRMILAKEKLRSGNLSEDEMNDLLSKLNHEEDSLKFVETSMANLKKQKEEALARKKQEAQQEIQMSGGSSSNSKCDYLSIESFPIKGCGDGSVMGVIDPNATENAKASATGNNNGGGSVNNSSAVIVDTSSNKIRINNSGNPSAIGAGMAGSVHIE